MRLLDWLTFIQYRHVGLQLGSNFLLFAEPLPFFGDFFLSFVKRISLIFKIPGFFDQGCLEFLGLSELLIGLFAVFVGDLISQGNEPGPIDIIQIVDILGGDIV